MAEDTKGWDEAIARAVEATRWRAPTICEAETTEDWRRAEWGIAVAVGAAHWTVLPPRWRRAINGCKRSNDCGIDLVGPRALYQVKWGEGRADISKAVAKLITIAGVSTCGVDFARVLCLREDYVIRAEVPGLRLVTVRHFGIGILRPLAPAAPTAQATPVPGREPDFAVTLDEAVTALLAVARRGQAVVSGEMPPGTGKSYVIERLAAAMGGPVLVVAPRVEIVHQLADLFAEHGWVTRKVCEAADFPALEGAGARVAVIMTGQSARKVPKGTRVNAVLYDEAHHAEGHELVDALVVRPTTFRLSATLGGQADYTLSYRDAVGRGLINDARFVFVAYAREPTFENVATHLAAHPEHGAVLACCRTQERAQQFARVVNGALGPDSARTYVSDDGNSSALGMFRTGHLRVLCVVTRVEMGVNIHRCDTILLIDPWDSMPRLRQLCGRASRLHPSKPGFYSVVRAVCADGDAEQTGLARLVGMLAKDVPEILAPDAPGLEDRIEIVAGTLTGWTGGGGGGGGGEGRGGDGSASSGAGAAAPPIADYVDVVRRTVYDSLGRHVADPQDVIRLEYSRCRETLAVRFPDGLADFVAYTAALQGDSEGKPSLLPPDPATYFAILFGAAFPWNEYLGRSQMTLDALRHRVRMAIALLGVETDGIARRELYSILRDADPKLPADPLTVSPSWDDIFAPW